MAGPARLCRRIERFIIENHIKELFVFLAEPDVPSDNNAAERSLPHLVISRKVSGGTRSAPGADSKMTLASIFLASIFLASIFLASIFLASIFLASIFLASIFLASIFGSWRAQGLNPLDARRQLLVSPRL